MNFTLTVIAIFLTRKALETQFDTKLDFTLPGQLYS